MSEQPPNSLLVKLEVLKKALKEERKRKNELEKEKELLQKQIEDLKEKIASFEKEQEIINNKLTESIQANNDIKLKHEEKINQLNKKNEDTLRKTVEQYEEKIKFLEEYIFGQNQRIKGGSILYDTQKRLFESLKIILDESNKISAQKTKEVEILLKDKNNLLKAIETDKEEILHLKDEIRQYKSIIEDLTPLSIDHLFQGFLIPTEKGMVKKRVDLSFGKYKQRLYFKAEDEEEKIFLSKEIDDIVYDKKSNNKVWLCVFIQGKQTNFLCEFTRKETEYIIRFYKSIIKGKPNTVENALLNVSLSGYYY